MKTNLITTTLTMLGAAAFAAEVSPAAPVAPVAPPPPVLPAPPIAPLKADTKISSGAGAISVTGDGSKIEIHTNSTDPKTSGKATITIDVNGKKETREIDLGNGTQIKVGGSNTLTIKSDTNAEPKPWLGVSAEEISDELRAQLPIAEGTGLIVRTVVPESPAAKAGLQKNDVLVKFDDQLLTNPQQLRTLVGTKKDGDSVRLTFLRRGRETTADATLALHAGGDPADEPWSLPKIIGDVWGQGAKKILPFSLQSKAVVIDKDGNVLTSKPAGEPGKLDVQHLDKTLRGLGVDEKAIEVARKAVEESALQIQKALGDVNAAKKDIKQQTEGAMRELAKAMEQARAAAEQARKQAEAAGKPTPEPQK